MQEQREKKKTMKDNVGDKETISLHLKQINTIDLIIMIIDCQTKGPIDNIIPLSEGK